MNNNNTSWRPWLDRLLIAALGLVAALVVSLWSMTRGQVTEQATRIEANRANNDQAHVMILSEIRTYQTTLQSELAAQRAAMVAELRDVDRRWSDIRSELAGIKSLLGPSATPGHP